MNKGTVFVYYKSTLLTSTSLLAWFLMLYFCSQQDVQTKLKKFVKKLRRQSTRQYRTHLTPLKRTARKLLTLWIKN